MRPAVVVRNDGTFFVLKNKMNRLTVAQAAYIAGIIDGEGYIAISKRKSSGSSHGAFFGAVIDIGSTSKELIHWMRRTIGLGSVNEHDRSRYNPVAKNVYRLGLSSRQAEQLIRVIRPYLVVKKAHADVLLEFVELPKGHGGSTPSSRSTWEAQHDCYKRMKALQSRKGLKR